MRLRLALLTTVAALLAVPATAAATDPWHDAAGADWSEHFIAEPDGTTLHADVLRPKGLAAGAKTPVILSIGPYFNHSGQTGPAGPAEGTSYDPVGPDGPQPSDRFKDFVVGAKLMQRGYTFVMVDLRGFGGSNGCLDWGGPGETADVKNSVEWAARQPWSTGAVGMYGKSYDGVTGLMGVASQPSGLRAVVSQEPVYDMYRYLYTNGVRYLNSLATPALYDLIAGTPGPLTDSPQYNADAIDDTARPGCPVQNHLDQAANGDHHSPYWQQRDLIASTHGKKTPLFLTQGFLENNTKPDGTWDLFNGMAGPKRAWLGMWDHIRGNETSAGADDAPQPFFDEVVRFYERHLKGAAVTNDPPVEVQTSDGTWRAETRWPAADATGRTTTLKPGSYVDTANNAGSAEGAMPTDTTGKGIWTISKKLPYPAHFAGVPKTDLEVASSGRDANLSVDVYDIDGQDNALLLSRTAQLLGAGEQHVTPEMYGNDWKIPAGHRLGVLVTTANDEWWTPTPSFATVTLLRGSVTLPFLARQRTATIPGKQATRLADWKNAAPFPVDAATIATGESPSFALPPAQTP